MRTFVHLNASTVEEAVLALRRYGGKAHAIAGGTDLLGKMKDEIVPAYPEAIINLKTIPELDFIREERGREATQRMSEEASNLQRKQAELGEIILGIKCGGSDTTSGVVSNPVAGFVADQVITQGGTVLFYRNS